MKRYEFVFDAEKETVLKHLLVGTVPCTVREYFKMWEQDRIYSVVRKDRVILFHGIPYRNGFRPVFSAKITEGEQAKLSGIWRPQLPVCIFMVGWYLILLFIALIPMLVHGEETIEVFYVAVAVFALLGAGFVKLGFLLEKKRMKKVMEYIERVQCRLEYKRRTEQKET